MRIQHPLQLDVLIETLPIGIISANASVAVAADDHAFTGTAIRDIGLRLGLDGLDESLLNLRVLYRRVTDSRYLGREPRRANLVVDVADEGANAVIG